MPDTPKDSMRAIQVVIPFFRNSELVGPILNSLIDCRDELQELRCSILLINDSPDDAELSSALQASTGQFPPGLAYTIQTNPSNMGFVRSVNSALKAAVTSGQDVVLLNSDTVLFPGVFRELQRVAYLDSMTGFVSPRSNNATICTFPRQSNFAELSPTAFHEMFVRIAGYLPAFHYVPTCVGFCLFIKHSILSELGLFDEAYGMGYNEENDLIMRANRLGFRAVLANHAFVYHIGERSFASSDTPKEAHERENFQKLNERYPEYAEQVAAYFRGAHWEAERLLAGLVPDQEGRIDVAFDCSHVGRCHNGTYRALAEVIRAAAAAWGDKFNIYVLTDPEVANFHEFDLCPRVTLCPADTDRVFGIAYRLGQPFDYAAFLRLNRIAPINVYAMLDTIAWDCLYLNRDPLDELWRATAQYADGILYISDFSRDQFHLRFPVRPGMPEATSYLSLQPDEYAGFLGEESTAGPSNGSYLLLVGNSLAHKNIEATVRALASGLPETKVVVLGKQGEESEHVTAYGSGHLAPAKVKSLFAGARAIVFPSTYEGFGIPVLEALAHRKVLYVRDSPLNRALHARLGFTKNVNLYESTSSLVRMLADNSIPEWSDEEIAVGEAHTWASHALDTERLLEEALKAFSYEGTLMPRLQFTRLLERAIARETQQAVVDPGPAVVEEALKASDVTPVLEELKAGIADVRAFAQSAIAEEIAKLAAEMAEFRATVDRRSESTFAELRSVIEERLASGAAELRTLVEERAASGVAELRMLIEERAASGASELRAIVEQHSASEVAALREIVNERSAHEVEELRALVDERSRAEIEELRALVGERDARITALQTSMSWNVTAPLRAAYGALLRARGKKNP